MLGIEELSYYSFFRNNKCVVLKLYHQVLSQMESHKFCGIISLRIYQVTSTFNTRLSVWDKTYGKNIPSLYNSSKIPERSVKIFVRQSGHSNLGMPL